MRMFGHRVHPYLIPFPIGLLTTAVIFDIVFLIQDEAKWAELSYWMIAAGILGGVVAGIFGAIDWTTIPSRTRAKSVATVHGVTNIIMLGVFGASWLIRYADEPTAPSTAPIVLGFIGVGLAMIGGWLGGELVERLGIGVYRHANPDAGTSLGFGIGSDDRR